MDLPWVFVGMDFTWPTNKLPYLGQALATLESMHSNDAEV